MSGELGTPDFTRGYMKLPHSVVRELLPDTVALATYVALLDRAAYVAGPRAIKGHGVVHLEIGEALFGRQELADAIGTTERPLRRSLKVLQTVGFVSIKTSKLGSIATIRGYGEIVRSPDEEGPTKGPNYVQPMVQTRSNGRSTKEDVKKERRKEGKTEREPAGVHVLRDLWVFLYKKHGHGDYVVRGPDWKLLKELEGSPGVEESSRRMHNAFEAPPKFPPWDPPWSLRTFANNINSCAQPSAPKQAGASGRVEPLPPGSYPDGEVPIE